MSNNIHLDAEQQVEFYVSDNKTLVSAAWLDEEPETRTYQYININDEATVFIRPDQIEQLVLSCMEKMDNRQFAELIEKACKSKYKGVA